MQLYHQLKEYHASGIYPFHMPGHKRNLSMLPPWNPWEIDVTEVEGTDNLHHAEGILKESMERVARLSGAEHSYFLVNGSTGGLLSAASAVTRPGDTVLVARNCHKSVYHALQLNQLKAVYVWPEWSGEYGIAGGISKERVEAVLRQQPQIRAVILTSPTYEGMVSDIAGLAAAAHRRGIPLIVDEAHGAHFGQPGFPVSAVRKGADLVVQSFHKTLPALTQTGVLHLCGERADRGRVEEYLGIYQTSSPSYVLMASIDYAASFLEHNQEKMEEYRERLSTFRKKTEELIHISVPERELLGKAAVYDVDNSKLILTACGKACREDGGDGSRQGISGKWLYERLRLDYGIQCEMAMESYALAMTSVMDTDEGLERLWNALRELDERICGITESRGLTGYHAISQPLTAVMTIAEARYAEKELCSLREAVGRISGEYLYLYPPGSPLLAPGERITEELLREAELLRQLGFELQGTSNGADILVCIEKQDRQQEEGNG